MARLPVPTDPNLLVGTNTADDAAVYRLNDETALVQTVDFFTPIVDDPYDFGRIAAANSLSDVYAMGATPLTALNIVGFPASVLPLDYLVEILKGGATVAAEAGVTIVGGHTIDDREPKYGLAVTGTVRPGMQVTNATARPGDVLVLTKPLGTGIIATAIKKGVADPAVVAEATACMVALNRDGAEAAQAHGLSSMTDVTGFGLLGHLLEMCRASGVSAEVWADGLPFLPGVRELALSGVVPGGTKRNLTYVEANTAWEPGFEEWERLMIADAQTSGGLLLAVPETEAEGLVAELRVRGTPAAAVMGRIGDAVDLAAQPHAGLLRVVRSAPAGIAR
jgi:selenide,water dikinase